MEKHYEIILRDTEERVFSRLRSQELDEKSPCYGGFYDRDRMVQAKYTIICVEPMITLYCNPDSRYYRNSLLAQRAELGLSYIRSVQHENGLFDYVTCNFFSAPDTAFCIGFFIPVYEYLQKLGNRTEQEEIFLHRVGEIVHDGAYGLLEGGFHTPNHRWAIASSLAKCGVLFNDKKLSESAGIYLIEGIDCNADGEFAEKSAGNYNSVNNDAMLMLSDATGDTQYEQHTIRNLHMMLTYWEPDGSIFTANSTRFDKDRLVYPLSYYIEYLAMGMKYDIPEFLGMCNTIFDIIEEKKISSPECLIYLMLHPEYRSFEYAGRYEQPDFVRLYEDSGILRARKGHYSYTVMREKSNFLYFHNGTSKLEMKVAGSFCEHRAFKAETMEILPGGTAHLHQTMRGWYYLPFEEKPETSDWWKMDQSKRKKKLGPDMEIDVYVEPAEGGIDVRVVTEGVQGAPWRVELAFSGIDYMASEHVMLPVNGSEVLVIKDPELEVYNEKDSLLIGPGFGEHRFTEGKEDSETKTPGAVTVYFTDYTAFDHTIRIRNRRDLEEKLLAGQ